MKNPFAFDVSTEDFDARVIEASFHTPVLVDFWAPWCAPCRSLAPALDKVVVAYQGRVLLARVNSDDNQALAYRFGVRGIPSVKAVVNGEVVDEFTGALPEAAIQEFIERILPSPAAAIVAEARAARAAGQLELAANLLAEAMTADPSDESVRLDLIELLIELGAMDDAAQVLASVAEPAKDTTRLEALRARVALLESAPDDEELASLRNALANAPDDQAARIALARKLAANRQFEEAMQLLLESVRQDRQFDEQAARRALVELFSACPDDALVRRTRSALGALLNG